MVSEAISGDEVLICGQLCVKNLAKLLPPFIDRLPESMFADANRPHFLANVALRCKNVVSNVRPPQMNLDQVSDLFV